MKSGWVKSVLTGLAAVGLVACGSQVDVAGPPTFSTVPTADGNTADELTAVNLSAAASGVTFSWSQVSPVSPVGTFSAPDQPDTSWTAPEILDVDNAVFQLRLTISDGKYLTSGDVFLTVANVNDPPQIEHVFVSDYDPYVGDTISVQVIASDRDGDPFTITWMEDPNQDPPGTLMDADQVTATWRPGAVAADTPISLWVDLDDGNGKTATRSTFVVNARVPDFDQHIQAIFDANCNPGCHNTGNLTGNLNLELGTAYTQLVGVAVNAAGPCNGVVTNRVQATDLNNSALWLKVTGQTACGTNRMPQGNPTYFDNNPAMLERIQSWILSGAN